MRKRSIEQFQKITGGNDAVVAIRISTLSRLLDNRLSCTDKTIDAIIKDVCNQLEGQSYHPHKSSHEQQRT